MASSKSKKTTKAKSASPKAAGKNAPAVKAKAQAVAAPKAKAPKRAKAATATKARGTARRTGAGTTLVIVESPTKARTIRGFLPAGYRVEASMGHVRDLPGDAKSIPAKYKEFDWARLGVNVENDFEPL